MTTLIPDIILRDNTSQRLPCVLVLDGSSSMAGDSINELNAGLKVLEEELKQDPVAAQRVQLYIIRIGGMDETEVLCDWTDAMDFSAPVVEANGNTPLGRGVSEGLAAIEKQKRNYKGHQIPYNRPWMFMITDGAPTEYDWEKHAEASQKAESDNKVVIFPIGTEGADFDCLERFSVRKPMKLRGLAFRELFVWLSRSASAGSQAAVDNTVQLPAAGWAEIPS